MVSLVHLVLACGVFYVGTQTYVKRRSKKKITWLEKSHGPPQRMLSALSTRVYIVRCWQEQMKNDSQVVMRYALEAPMTGQRYGYTKAKSLLETLSMELANAQSVQPSGQLDTDGSRASSSTIAWEEEG